MKLFNEHADPRTNLLPSDGAVYYHGAIFARDEADEYCNKLLNTIDWRRDEALIYGKRITTKREVAWYGERAFDYTYSGVTRKALPWTEALLQLKQTAEQHSGSTFNSCLLNLYHDGTEGMAWHSDAEKDLIKHGVIASLSFGAERRFLFKHKQSGQKVEQVLEHGSLLIMSGATQDHWLHSLPKSARIHTPRINLTFRTIRESGGRAHGSV